uniref:DUF2807 domain-containing protein n=1 Tax=Roseihalotalea indica TaxID=2867963 RepID=A0AA49JE26_9BACT|nr:DUF2807 domain-containing protein [Tunicatimonas sp. TK19036]
MGIYLEKTRMKLTKLVLTLLLVYFLAGALAAQETTQRTIESFTQVVVSEGIDLVLEQGDRPALRLAYTGLKPEVIVTQVSGKKLKIYLEGCKRGCAESAQREYRGSKVIAYLTYTELRKLVVMGDNEVINKSPIQASKFILRSYGDNTITLRNVEANRWKAALYGDSDLLVENGKVSTLKIKAYGDNTINTRQVTSGISKVHSLGDNNVQLQAQDRLNVTVLGDATIRYDGQPWVAKRLVLGDLSLQAR